jgi:hypothetical protein
VHCATKHKELAIDEQPVKRKAAATGSRRF